MTVACSFTLGPQGVHTIPTSSVEPATKKRAVEHPLLAKPENAAAATSAKIHHGQSHRRHQRSYPATFQPFGGKVISPQQLKYGESSSNYIVELFPGQVSRPRLACDPPVLEIQIPAKSTESNEHQEIDEHDDNSSWIQGSSAEGEDYESFEHMESYKSKYFVAQRDLHVERQKSASLEHENARLKRHVFELQRRLYESQRKRQRVASSWDVPRVTVQRAISAEESERKTLAPRV